MAHWLVGVGLARRCAGGRRVVRGFIRHLPATGCEPFAERQVALVKTFADQAIIAMENARLLGELREALDQQTATTEVLQVINSSPGELEPVFEAILEKAMQACHASFGGLWIFDAGRYVAAALHKVPKAYADFLRTANSGSWAGVGALPFPAWGAVGHPKH